MNRVVSLRPLISVLTIISSLLFLVFLQMEERRVGYAVLRLSRSYREKMEELRHLEIQLARALRLEKMESLAARKFMRRAGSDQVIYLNLAEPIEARRLEKP